MQDLFKHASQEPFDPSRLADLSDAQRPIIAEALELARNLGHQYQLDLSPGSAASLDQILRAQRDTLPPEHAPVLVRGLGAYLASLLIEHLQAEPLLLKPFPLLLRLPPGTPNTAPLYTSHHRLALDAWEGQNPRFAEAFEGLMEAEDIEFDRPLFVPSYPAPENEGAEVWLRAQSLQVLFGQFENSTWNLTYVPHNLRFLDVYLMRTLNPTQSFRLSTLSDEREPQDQWLIQATAAFFGEMTRQHMQAQWIAPERGPLEMHMHADGSRFSPLRICADALQDNPGNYPLLRAYKQLMDFQNEPTAEHFPLVHTQVDEALLVSSGMKAISSRPPLPRMPQILPSNEGQNRTFSILSDLRRKLASGEALDVEATQMLDVTQLRMLESEAQRFAQSSPQDSDTSAYNLQLLQRLQGQGAPAETAPLSTGNPQPTSNIERTLESDVGELIATHNTQPPAGTPGSSIYVPGVYPSAAAQTPPPPQEPLSASHASAGYPSEHDAQPNEDEDRTRNMDRSVLMASLNAMLHNKTGLPNKAGLPNTPTPIQAVDPDATSEISLDQLQAARAHMMLGPNALQATSGPSHSAPAELSDTAAHDVPPGIMSDTADHDAPINALGDTAAHDTPLGIMSDTADHDIPPNALADTADHAIPSGMVSDTAAYDVPPNPLGDTAAHDVPPAFTPHATHPDSSEDQDSWSSSRVEELEVPHRPSIRPSTGEFKRRPTGIEPLPRAPSYPAETDRALFDAPTVHGKMPADLLRRATPDTLRPIDKPADGTIELAAVIQASQGPTAAYDQPDPATMAAFARRLQAPSDTSADEAVSFVFAEDDEHEDEHEEERMSARRVSGNYAPFVFDHEEESPDPIPSAKTYPTRLISIMNRLVPILVPAGWEGQEQVSSRSILPNSPYEARLPRVTVGIDQEGQLRYINPQDLVSWGCTFDVLCDLAGMNLSNRPLHPEAHFHASIVQGLNIYQVDTGGNFEASLSLTSRLGEVARDAIGTDHLWLAAPNRHTLLITPMQDSSDTLQAFAGIVRYTHDTRPEPLCDEIFLYTQPGPRLQNIVTL